MAITVKLLLKHLGNACVLYDTSKVRNVTFIFQNCKFLFNNVTKIGKKFMGSEKSTNLFEMEKNGLPDYLLHNFSFLFI